MHLIETYSLSCGSKINKPYIYDTYFPNPFEKYITLQAQSQQNIDAKHYSYWQDVIDLIYPILEKHKIKIVQVGLDYETMHSKVVDLRGKTNINQLAYIIKNSLLHVGPDSFGVHLASHYNIPIVSLYSSTMPEIAGPYFGEKNKQILFKCYERVGNKKPSYAITEFPKSINTIFPEEIAQAILNLLNINFILPLKTVFIGQRYGNGIIRELVPNNPSIMSNPDAPVEIRYDLSDNEQILAHHLKYLKKSIIITNKNINLELLKVFKPHIAALVYKITEDDNIDFVKNVINLGIPVTLISDLSPEKIIPKKIKYYDVGGINKVDILNDELRNQLLPKLNNLYYKSNKLISSNGSVYYSLAALENNFSAQNHDEYQKVIDSPSFWKNTEFYTIVEKLVDQNTNT